MLATLRLFQLGEGDRLAPLLYEWSSAPELDDSQLTILGWGISFGRRAPSGDNVPGVGGKEQHVSLKPPDKLTRIEKMRLRQKAASIKIPRPFPRGGYAKIALAISWFILMFARVYITDRAFFVATAGAIDHCVASLEDGPVFRGSSATRAMLSALYEIRIEWWVGITLAFGSFALQWRYMPMSLAVMVFYVFLRVMWFVDSVLPSGVAASVTSEYRTRPVIDWYAFGPITFVHGYIELIIHMALHAIFYMIISEILLQYIIYRVMCKKDMDFYGQTWMAHGTLVYRRLFHAPVYRSKYCDAARQLLRDVLRENGERKKQERRKDIRWVDSLFV